MCQLLGINSALPTDFRFSLKAFCRRGGETDKHADGWGAAIYEGRGILCFQDTQAACRSPVAQFLVNRPNPIRTCNMMAHIRYATVGKVRIENVHPFARDLWGIPFSFCHNGECPPFAHRNGTLPLLGQTKLNDIVYWPMGDTDSEAVFCSILNALRVEYPLGPPPLPVLFSFLSQLCCEITTLSDCAAAKNSTEENSNIEKMPTIFNFLLGCGPHTLFAYSWPGARPGSKVWNGLHYIVREHPFSTAQLIDDDDTGGFVDFRKFNTQDDRVAVISTKPLTREQGWVELAKGQLVLFEKGRPFFSAQEIVNQEMALAHSSSELLLSTSNAALSMMDCDVVSVSDEEEEYAH